MNKRSSNLTQIVLHAIPYWASVLQFFVDLCIVFGIKFDFVTVFEQFLSFSHCRYRVLDTAKLITQIMTPICLN